TAGPLLRLRPGLHRRRLPGQYAEIDGNRGWTQMNADKKELEEESREAPFPYGERRLSALLFLCLICVHLRPSAVPFPFSSARGLSFSKSVSGMRAWPPLRAFASAWLA